MALQRFEVSIHAPAWGATPPVMALMASIEFQSTHPRGVRLAIFQHLRQGLHIVSIHAPAWGATRYLLGQVRDLLGFNPRTRVGCDTGRGVHEYFGIGFNPRTRVGCDQLFLVLGWCHWCFNPRTRVGCDVTGARHAAGEYLVSIHAPAWGATLPWSARCFLYRRFNPRTRVGCDMSELTPTRLISVCFNPRTRVGCDFSGF